MLEVRTTYATFSYVDSDVREEMGLATGSADVAALPVSFRALRLHASRMYISVAENSGGPVLQSVEEAQEVKPAAELCRFLNLAPKCYEEFRVYAGGEHPAVTVSAAYDLEDEVAFSRRTVKLSSLQVLASAMQRHAGDHRLTVGLSSDATHLHVIRVKTSG